MNRDTPPIRISPDQLAPLQGGTFAHFPGPQRRSGPLTLQWPVDGTATHPQPSVAPRLPTSLGCAQLRAAVGGSLAADQMPWEVLQ